MVTCPADTTVNCDGDRTSANTGLATATDNCDNGVTLTESDAVASGSCPQEEVITRTWTGTDACGNVSSCDQIITTVDNEAPVITCPGASSVECIPAASGANCFADLVGVIVSTDSSNTGSATATDNCDTPSVSYTDSSTAGTCAQEMVITRSWTAADGCGNSSSCEQVVTVVDNTAPSITCPADLTLAPGDSTSPNDTGSATAADNCDPNPASTYSDSSTGTGVCPEIITRTWTATDVCGNSDNCAQTIQIVDNVDPVISCPDDMAVECDISLAPENTGGSATATDDSDQSVDITHSDSTATGTCAQEGVITRTWTATDDCGNTSSCNQDITVADSQAPGITCPADSSIECIVSSASANCIAELQSIAASTDSSVTGSATATDNCDTAVDISFSDSLAQGTCANEKEIIRTWTANDNCGNANSCDQTINVVDNSAPSITCPANATINCEDDSTSAATGIASATDNCDCVLAIT